MHTKNLDVEFNGLELRGGKDMEGVTPVQTAVLGMQRGFLIKEKYASE